MSEAVELITSVGFPIGMCLIMAKYVQYLTDGFKQTIESNTKAINKMSTILASSQLDRKEIVNED